MKSDKCDKRVGLNWKADINKYKHFGKWNHWDKTVWINGTTTNSRLR